MLASHLKTKARPLRHALLLAFAMLGAVFAAAAEDVPVKLTEVKSWLLLLNNDLGPRSIERIGQIPFDMVVVDHVSSQKNVPETASGNAVKRLQRGPDGTRRQVIAYLNIGQAEDYRTYWMKGWRVGKPAFILGTDPDGWAGNFPVAYWRQEWRQLITGPGGLIEQIRAAGFDGLYLDWVGGFEDENVVAAARRDGVDARLEMIAWVREVSAVAKGGERPLFVIAQNAAPLLQDSSYLDAIDGVSHEDIWFTGADGLAEGDCPVPRTAAEVGSAAYLARLDKACRRSHDTDPVSAMHFVGEDVIVPLLKLAQDRGKAVFTVDYALKVENIAAARKASRSFGFAPFVGARNLNTIVGLPHADDGGE